MRKLLSVCIEDLDASNPDERYVRCVAMPGREPGLRVDSSGGLLWRTDEGAACELWVSADERLVLWRREQGPRVVVTRAGRSLPIPESKPVMLLDGDSVEIAGRHLRVHLHGEAPNEAPPEPIVMERRRPVFRTAATAAIVGATLVAGAAAAAEQEPIEVREQPPAPPYVPPPDASADAGTDADAEPETGEPPEDSEAGSEGQPDTSTTPIEVRETPPAPPPPPPAGGCCSKQPGMASGWRRGKL